MHNGDAAGEIFRKGPLCSVKHPAIIITVYGHALHSLFIADIM